MSLDELLPRVINATPYPFSESVTVKITKDTDVQVIIIIPFFLYIHV